MWLDNHDDEPLDFEDSQEVLEEIDQDEVFGSGSLSFFLRMILLNVLQILSVRYLTLNIEA